VLAFGSSQRELSEILHRLNPWFKVALTLIQSMNLICFVYLHNNSWKRYCRTVTCYALDGILLVYFMKDDKMCVYSDRSESHFLASVYITKLKINMVMTFMKNHGCVIDKFCAY
jgi:hypothetical protein